MTSIQEQALKTLLRRNRNIERSAVAKQKRGSVTPKAVAQMCKRHDDEVLQLFRAIAGGANA